MVVAILFALAAASLPLQPAGRWVIGYNDNDCTLQRSFGDPARPTTFGFKPEPTNIAGDLVLVLPGAADRVRRGKGRVTLGPGGAQFDASWVSAPLSGARHGVRFTIGRPFWDALPDAQTVTFEVGEPQPITARLGPMTAALAATKACGDDLLRGWGADPDGLIPASDYDDRIARVFDADAYPAEALRLHQQGRVRSLTIVDRNGRPTLCRVVQSSGAPSLDAQTCALVMNNARFRAAADAPERRFLFLPVRWLLPD